MWPHKVEPQFHSWYRGRVEILDAIIPLTPNIDTAFFFFCTQRGEVESALSDYSRVTELDPTCTEPLRRQAMHKFNKE